jgi:hypothetical protein
MRLCQKTRLTCLTSTNVDSRDLAAEGNQVDLLFVFSPSLSRSVPLCAKPSVQRCLLSGLASVSADLHIFARSNTNT